MCPHSQAYRRDEKHDFAFGFSSGEVGVELGAGAVVEGLKGFGELARDADSGFRRELGEDLEGRWQAVGRLEEEGGVRRVKSGLKLLPAFAFFDREEAVKRKGMGREAGGNESRGDSGRTGEDGEGDFGVPGGFEKAVTGIGKAGVSGI